MKPSLSQSSPPSSPSSRSILSSSSARARARARAHVAPEETSQMSVLGLDGRDFSDHNNDSSSIENYLDFSTPRADQGKKHTQTPLLQKEHAPVSRAKQVAATLTAAASASTKAWIPPTLTKVVGITNNGSDAAAATAAGNTRTTAVPKDEKEGDGASFLTATQTPDSNVHASFGEDCDSSSSAPVADTAIAKHSAAPDAATVALPPSTREDQLRQNCSFFYRDMDDDTNKGNQGKRKSTNPRRSRRNKRKDTVVADAAVGDYTCMVDPHDNDRQQQSNPSLTSFRARYDQLNAVLHPDIDSEGDDDAYIKYHNDRHGQTEDVHDLEFQISTQQQQQSLSSVCPPPGGEASCSSPRVAEFTKSSLSYFHHQDGRVLMRLPQDNIRLLVDPDLEPGILSVETQRCGRVSSSSNPQRQHQHQPYRSAATPIISNHLSNDNEKEREQSEANLWKEELTYVLTVDDDLYQRVVKEMVDSAKTPCGLYYCCQGNESAGQHVHIWIAVFLLSIVLTFLLVNTIIYPF